MEELTKKQAVFDDFIQKANASQANMDLKIDQGGLAQKVDELTQKLATFDKQMQDVMGGGLEQKIEELVAKTDTFDDFM